MDIESLKEWANTQNIGTANMSYHKAQEHVLEIINESNQVIEKSATSEDAFPSAIKWTGKNLREVIDLTGWNESASSKWTWAEYEQVVEEKGLKIFTPSGSVMADIGDWIIYNGKDCYVTTQKNKSATSEEVTDDWRIE